VLKYVKEPKTLPTSVLTHEQMQKLLSFIPTTDSRGCPVHRAKFFGRCEQKTGMVPFDRLVDQVMTQAPYGK
jgi:hypothetical protein